MKTRLILKPGQRGTKQLVKKYGDALLCVRFKYDAQRGRRLKTVELLEEETEWSPRYKPATLVPLRIMGYDMLARKMAKEAGARWNPDKRLWYVEYGKIVGTQLEKHIHIDASG